MNNKNLLIGAVAVVAILGAWSLWGGSSEAPVPTDRPILGAMSGPDILSYLNVHGVLTEGGGVRATSTLNSAETLLGSDFDSENIIDFTSNVTAGTVTVTLPASTTVPLGTDVGSKRTVWIRNATTTAAVELLIAGGTGTLLKVASSTPSAARIYGDTDGGNHGRLEFLRKANSDIEVFFQNFKD